MDFSFALVSVYADSFTMKKLAMLSELLFVKASFTTIRIYRKERPQAFNN